MRNLIALLEQRNSVAVSRRRAHGIVLAIGVLALTLGVREAAATNKWAGGCDSVTDYCASFRLRDQSPDGTIREMTACCGRQDCCCHTCAPDCTAGAMGCCDDCCDQYLGHVCCSVATDTGPGTASHTNTPPGGACPGAGVVITRISLLDGSDNTVEVLCDDGGPDPCPDNCDAPPITQTWTFGDGPEDILTLAEMRAFDCSGGYQLLLEGAVSGTPIGGGGGLLLQLWHPKGEEYGFKPDVPRRCPAVSATGLMIGSGLLLVAGIAVFRKGPDRLINLGC